MSSKMLNFPRRSTTSTLCLPLLCDPEASIVKEDETVRLRKAFSKMEGWQTTHTVLREWARSSESGGAAGRHRMVTGPIRSYG